MPERETGCTADCTCAECLPEVEPEERRRRHVREALACRCIVCADWLAHRGVTVR